MATTMSTYRGKPADVLNCAMKIYLPETKNNTYADFPMNNPRWYKGNEKIPHGPLKGKPCFIKTGNTLPDNIGVKDGYVWGPGEYSWGYYSLVTKSAHSILYARILSNKVTISGEGDGCFGCFKARDPRTVMPKPTNGLTKDDMDDLRVLFHARSGATKGHDGVAMSDQHEEATNTAQAYYKYDNFAGQGFAAGDVKIIKDGIRNNVINPNVIIR